MEGALAVVRNVNTILSQQLDETNQYSRRSCNRFWKPGKDDTTDEDSKRVISTIASEAGLDKGEFLRHVDKAHPERGTKNGKQSKIIKFTTHSFKEMVFLKHNKIRTIKLRKRNKIWNKKVEFTWMSHHPYPDSELSC